MSQPHDRPADLGEPCGVLPVHPAQVGMIEGHLQVPGNAAYSVRQIRWIHGPLDVDAYVATTELVVAEAECTRTRFFEGGDGWHQAFDAEPHIEVTDWTGRPADAEAHLRARAAEPFDIRSGEPLFRLELAIISPTEHIEMAAVHHSVADGYGTQLLLQRHATVYEALANGSPVPPGPHGSLRDLLVVEACCDADLTFWRDYLARPPARLALSDLVAPPSSDVVLRRIVASGLRSALVAAVGEIRWPYAAIASAAESVADVLGTSDVILGCALAARRGSEELQVPGMLMTVLPMRLDVSDRSRRALLRAVAQGLTTIGSHVKDRPEQLRAELPIAWRRGRIHGPTVNVVPFAVDPGLAGCTVEVDTLARGPVDDAMVTIVPDGDHDLLIDVAGNPACYDAAAVDHLAELVLAHLTSWADRT